MFFAMAANASKFATLSTTISFGSSCNDFDDDDDQRGIVSRWSQAAHWLMGRPARSSEWFMTRRIIRSSSSSASRRLLVFVLVGSAVWLIGLATMSMKATANRPPESEPVEANTVRVPTLAGDVELTEAKRRLKTREQLLLDARRRLDDARRRLDLFLDQAIGSSNHALAGNTVRNDVDESASSVNHLAELLGQRSEMLEKMTPAHPAVIELDRQIAIAEADRRPARPAKVNAKITRPAGQSPGGANDRAALERLRAEVANAERQVQLNEADQRSALVDCVRLEEAARHESLATPEELIVNSFGSSFSVPLPSQTWLLGGAAAVAGLIAALIVRRRRVATWYLDEPHDRASHGPRKHHSLHGQLGPPLPPPHFVRSLAKRRGVAVRTRRRK